MNSFQHIDFCISPVKDAVLWLKQLLEVNFLHPVIHNLELMITACVIVHEYKSLLG